MLTHVGVAVTEEEVPVGLDPPATMQIGVFSQMSLQFKNVLAVSTSCVVMPNLLAMLAQLSPVLL